MLSPPPSAYIALITAAGASSRMGRPKALVAWKGVPLLLHQARVLAASGAFVDVVAVVGKDAAPITAAAAAWDAPLRLVVNPRWEDGRSTSLEVGAAALASHGSAGMLIAAVDQPLEAEVVAALLDDPPAPGEVAIPVHAGRRGHPVLLAASLVAEVARASAYPEGLRDIVRAARGRLVEVASPAIHLDLNTPDDLSGREGADR